MKDNRIKRNHRKLALTIGCTALVAVTLTALAFGFCRLKELWLEQSVIRNMSRQVAISSGKMVKADVLAENFGLKTGANLALIDFTAKRKELLKRIPNLKSITVARHLPDRVEITTEEREPIVRVNIRGRRNESGKVADAEGVVFICQRGTGLLPVIRESAVGATAPGHRLDKRARAALALLDVCRDSEFQELAVLEADITRPDYILATLGSTYAQVKIAWEAMDEDTPAARSSLRRQLRLLTKAMHTSAGGRVSVWNATDFSSPGRIYADMKGNQK